MSSRCIVEAPDAFAAFVLARHIDPVGGAAQVESNGRGFLVSLETDADRLPHVLAVVQLWLAEERIAHTTVSYDGRVEQLRAA